MAELKINACACQTPSDNGGGYCAKCNKMLRRWVYGESAATETRPTERAPMPRLCVCESPTNDGHDSCVRCKMGLPLYMRKEMSLHTPKNKNEPARRAYSKDEICTCVLPIENTNGMCWECKKVLPEHREDAKPHTAFKYEDFVPNDCECAEDRARFGNGVTCMKCQWPCPHCPAWNFKTDTECAECMMPFSYDNRSASSRDARNPNRNEGSLVSPSALENLGGFKCPNCGVMNTDRNWHCTECKSALVYPPLRPNGGDNRRKQSTRRFEDDDDYATGPSDTFPALAKHIFVRCSQCGAPNPCGLTCARCREAHVCPPSRPFGGDDRQNQSTRRFEDDDDVMLQLALRLSLEESLDKQQDTILTNFVEEALVLVPHDQTTRALSTVGFHVPSVNAMSRSSARRMIVWAYYKDPAAHIHFKKMPRDVLARVLVMANLATVHMTLEWMKRPF